MAGRVSVAEVAPQVFAMGATTYDEMKQSIFVKGRQATELPSQDIRESEEQHRHLTGEC